MGDASAMTSQPSLLHRRSCWLGRAVRHIAIKYHIPSGGWRTPWLAFQECHRKESKPVELRENFKFHKMVWVLWDRFWSCSAGLQSAGYPNATRNSRWQLPTADEVFAPSDTVDANDQTSVCVVYRFPQNLGKGPRPRTTERTIQMSASSQNPYPCCYGKLKQTNNPIFQIS